MKEKKIKFFDPNIKRKSEIIKNSLQFIKGTNVPLPSLVEISDSGTCNRKCSFCPRSDPNYQDIKEFITEKLHTKICKELSEHNYKGMLIYSGFNEPLLNKKIYNNISTARKLQIVWGVYSCLGEDAQNTKERSQYILEEEQENTTTT